ncbi:MAG: metal-dependent hydrolase [Flavobacteriales bacterium AspAUS03]
MRLTFYAHATYTISLDGKHVLIDPFFTGNPIFKKDQSLAQGYINELPVDFILVTHAHHDHVSDVEAIAKRTGATVISNYEIAFYFAEKGLKTIGLNYGSFVDFEFGKIKYVWATHSSTFEDGSYGGNPGGFVLQTDQGNVYIAGDTALTQEMKLIPLFTELDLAVLPIGGVFTMGPIEAVFASDFLGCDRVLGVHYDTFSMIAIDHDAARGIFTEKGKELILLGSGKSLEV